MALQMGGEKKADAMHRLFNIKVTISIALWYPFQYHVR